MSRRLAIWLILVLMLVAAIAAARTTDGVNGAATTSLSQGGTTYDGRVVQRGSLSNSVAMIPVTGAITDGSSAPDGSSTGGDDIVNMLDAIDANREDWSGVLLELDTPGGSVMASEDVAAAIKRLRDHDVPVVAWMRGTAASAGYYMASQTDRIVASPNTFTGSIGVIMEYLVVDGLARKVGVQQVTIKSGKLKDMGSPFRQPTADEQRVLQTIIMQAYDQFVGAVADGRHMSEEDVRRIADGRVYTGLQAEKLGLVDRLGLRRDAYDELGDRLQSKVSGRDLRVVEFTRRYGLLASLRATANTGDMAHTAIVNAIVGALASGADAPAGTEVSASAGSSIAVGNGFARLQYRAVL